ncbi:TPA: preprotein translocase subunit SecE [Candidatus Acetothermia bacterium]|nr:preprotein translocase subunit SecE [Candidatus Acetothermia bacterium]HAZ30912.1 preprotein translocase subunit SecE [Candidatus Acetothermia bacterium]
MNVLTRVRDYVRSVRTEVGRVSWPSRKEVASFTVLIILLAVVLGIYLGLADIILQQILRLLLR